jgi:hypothetical protein
MPVGQAVGANLKPSPIPFNVTDSVEEQVHPFKVFAGISEIDHENKIMTQDHIQLVRKPPRAAVRFKWDGRKRFSPPVASEFPSLSEGAKANTEFHKRCRSKVGFVGTRCGANNIQH